MTCSACQDKPMGKRCESCGKLPPVLQISNEECPVLFHTVELPSTQEEDPPYIGRYKNVLSVYSDGTWALYNSDGVYSIFGAGVDFDSLVGRPKYDGEEMTSSTNIPNVETTVNNAIATEEAARRAADTALQNSIDAEASARQAEDSTLSSSINSLSSSLSSETTARQQADATLQSGLDAVDSAINTSVMTDLVLDPATSTTVVQLDTTKKNLKTSVTVTDNVPLPVASATQAGVMNSSTYSAIVQNTQNIANIKGQVVAISGLPANPTQAELTTAWINASGEPSLINGAGIFDVTNEKRWTYYSNDNTWHAIDAHGSVTVNTWTNSAAGIVKGSTNTGQIFAESDGTGSVNGWDALKAQADNATSKLATIESGAEVNVQSDWAQTNSTADDYIKNKPTVDSSLSSSSTNAVENQAIDAEFEKVAYVGTTLSTPTSVAYVAEDNIQDSAVTTNKIADGAITSEKIDFTTLSPSVTTLANLNSAGGSVPITLDTPLTDDETICLVSGHLSKRTVPTFFPVSLLKALTGVALGAPTVCFAGSGFVGITYTSSTSITVHADVANPVSGTNATDTITRVLRITPR